MCRCDSLIIIFAALCCHWRVNNALLTVDPELVWLDSNRTPPGCNIHLIQLASETYQDNKFHIFCDALLPLYVYREYCNDIPHRFSFSGSRERLTGLIRYYHMLNNDQNKYTNAMHHLLVAAATGLYTHGGSVGRDDSVDTVILGVWPGPLFTNGKLYGINIQSLGTGNTGAILFNKLLGQFTPVNQFILADPDNRDVIALIAWYKGESAMLAKLSAR